MCRNAANKTFSKHNVIVVIVSSIFLPQQPVAVFGLECVHSRCWRLKHIKVRESCMERVQCFLNMTITFNFQTSSKLQHDNQSNFNSYNQISTWQLQSNLIMTTTAKHCQISTWQAQSNLNTTTTAKPQHDNGSQTSTQQPQLNLNMIMTVKPQHDDHSQSRRQTVKTSTWQPQPNIKMTNSQTSTCQPQSNLHMTNNNNNDYLERLTHTGPKRLHVLYKYILWKFNAYNMNAHMHAHTQTTAVKPQQGNHGQFWPLHTHALHYMSVKVQQKEK